MAAPQHPQEQHADSPGASTLRRTPDVIAPGHTFETVSDTIGNIVLSKRTPIGWFFGFAIAFTLLMILKKM